MAYPGNSVGYKIFQEWNKFGLVALSFFIAVNNAIWNDNKHEEYLHSFRSNPRHFEKKEFLKWLAWYLVKDWWTCFLRRQSSLKKHGKRPKSLFTGCSPCVYYFVLHLSSESSKSSKRPKSLITGCFPCVYYFVLNLSSESSKCWKTSYF